MIGFLLSLLIIGLLTAMFWQDLKSRSVHAWLLCTLPLLILIKAWPEVQEMPYWTSRGINLGLLLLQGALLTGYLSIRGFKRKELLNAIGVGDLLFWLIIALYFSTMGFVMFFPVSLFTALLFHIILGMAMKKYYQSSVPLAGFQALCLSAWIGIETLGSYSEQNLINSIVQSVITIVTQAQINFLLCL